MKIKIFGKKIKECEHIYIPFETRTTNVKTKMTTIFLEDRVGELTYCPKCNSPMQIKEILKKFKVYETTRYKYLSLQ